MIPKSALGIAAAGAGICFIGYCVYFDRKRRSHPDFKQRLREKRRQSRKNAPGEFEFPDLTNLETRQKFFYQEMLLGEELISAGEIEAGVEHLSYAIHVSGSAVPILNAIEQTLPPQVFALLLEKLGRLSALSPSGLSNPSPKPTSDAVLAEDDVE